MLQELREIDQQALRTKEDEIKQLEKEVDDCFERIANLEADLEQTEMDVKVMYLSICCITIGFGFLSYFASLMFNSLPYNTILDLSKFKAFADDKIKVTQKFKFTFRRIENIVGKGENAGYQHFLLFPQCFQKLSFPEVLKVEIVSKRFNKYKL